jgi:hypothetical protein
MTHKLIKTGNYLLVVDYPEIKEGDWMTNNLDVWQSTNYYGFQPVSKKIIAHLPLNNSPLLEGVDLLPTLEDDVEKLAMDKLKSKWSHLYQFGYPKKPYPTNYENDLNMVMVGIYQAKEKYKYTEEDLRFAIKNAFMQGVERVPYLHQLEDNIIKALQQPKYPVAFECDYEPIIPYQFTSEDNLEVKPKTITNSQGQTVLVGAYKYE